FATSIRRTNGQPFRHSRMRDALCVRPTFSMIAITNTGTAIAATCWKNSNMRGLPFARGAARAVPPTAPRPERRRPGRWRAPCSPGVAGGGREMGVEMTDVRRNRAAPVADPTAAPATESAATDTTTTNAAATDAPAMDPPEMLPVPGGTYRMGSDRFYP